MQPASVGGLDVRKPRPRRRFSRRWPREADRRARCTYSAIIRSTSQRRSTSFIPVQRSRCVAEVITADDLARGGALRSPSVQIGREVGVLRRVEVEIRFVVGDEEKRYVAALEVLLKPPALDGRQVSNEPVQRQRGRRQRPVAGLLGVRPSVRPDSDRTVSWAVVVDRRG